MYIQLKLVLKTPSKQNLEKCKETWRLKNDLKKISSDLHAEKLSEVVYVKASVYTKENHGKIIKVNILSYIVSFERYINIFSYFKILAWLSRFISYNINILENRIT